MEITDPRFLVEKPKKERTPAQKAATAKGLAVLKERRAAAAARVPVSKPAAAAAPVAPVAAPVAAPAAAAAIVVSKLPAKKKKRVVYVEESSSSSSSEEEVIIRRKKPTLPPVGTPLALSIPVVPDTRPPPVAVPAPVKPAHIARSAVLSRLFDKN
jgi:hypothetical protein